MAIKRILHLDDDKYEIIQSDTLILGRGMNLEIIDEASSLRVVVFFEEDPQKKLGMVGLMDTGEYSSQLTIYNSMKNEIIAPGAFLQIGYPRSKNAERYLLDFIIKGYGDKKEFKYNIFKEIKE